jgi:ABC-type protease/lipase transport system fused ATPase/permease subunit
MLDVNPAKAWRITFSTQVAILSSLLNALYLGPPLFMMNVYDRVLTGGSVETLVVLSALMFLCYASIIAIEVIRARIISRTFEVMERELLNRFYENYKNIDVKLIEFDPTAELDKVRGYINSPLCAVIYDIPWCPIYIFICFLLHFWLGMTVLAGIILISVLGFIPNILSLKHAKSIGALDGIRRLPFQKGSSNSLKQVPWPTWLLHSSNFVGQQRKIQDVFSATAMISRGLRVALQSSVIGVGAWLVLGNEINTSVMLSASILGTRALTPLDMLANGWASMTNVAQSWIKLIENVRNSPTNNVIEGEIAA